MLISPPVPALLGRFRLVGVLPVESPQRLAAQFRGAVAARFPQDPDFHGHQGERTLYRYPRVQYRWLDDGPALFLIGEAGERARAQDFRGGSLQLGGNRLRVADVTWQPLALGIAAAPEPRRYRFGAPWLALNQENNQRYAQLSPRERPALLARILTSNLLSTFKGLGWTIPPELRIAAEVESPREVVCPLKDLSLRGFLASFTVNLHLPDGLALGRSVSHGFGWIEAQADAAQRPPRSEWGPLPPGT